MDIQLRASDDVDATLRQLHDWLRRDTAVRRTARVSLRPAVPEPGTMGASLEAVQLIVDSGFQLAGLALALAAWREARAPRTPVTITIDSISVTLSPDQLADAKEILRELEGLRGAAPAEGGREDDAGG